MSAVGALIRKEFLLEWKQRYALNGLLMYALTMSFVIALAMKRDLDPGTWNAVYWIILLFVAVNAVAKSFMGENEGQGLYLYTLASPLAIITAKLLYNCLLLVGVAFVTLIFYAWLSAPEFEIDGVVIAGGINFGGYALFIFLGCCGFAANLTLVSAIASRAQNKTTLLAVLGFPLLIPQLMTVMSGSKKVLTGFPLSESWGELAFSGGFFVIIALVSFILFPFLWRE